MTQKEFGRVYGIGSQSFVAQLLNGVRPLNYELAAKFAKALHCTIYDICPEMDTAVRLELLPFLGKALRRVAVVLLALLLPITMLFTPTPAEASFNITYYTMRDRLRRRMLTLLQQLRTGRVASA
jgi:transcriptional regulator with XRE-family HTH domain